MVDFVANELSSSGNIRCRITYRRTEDVSSPSNEVSASVQDTESEEELKSDTQRRDTNRRDDTTEDEIGNFTRGHILSRSPALSLPPPPPPPQGPSFQDKFSQSYGVKPPMKQRELKSTVKYPASERIEARS